MDAAETGHLVFTTLHANSASTSLTRLLDMEVPKYKLNASVRGVLAQRLLRKVCTGCAVKRPISESEANEFVWCRVRYAVRIARDAGARKTAPLLVANMSIRMYIPRAAPMVRTDSIISCQQSGL